jgi:uncharacterized coiled-coil protein SlyX
MDASSTSRLDSLESHLVHLERQYDELNEVVIQQGKELSWLRQQLVRVSSSVEGMELDRIKAHNPKPPHSVI